LQTHGHVLRPQVSVPFERWRKGRGKTKAHPPFGFCYFEGEIIKDPKEYPTIQLIQNLWKQGISISSIVLHLDGRGIQSRMKKPWAYNVIKSIIRRLQDGSLELLISKSKTHKAGKKLKGVENESR
jgi:hypothetical protein